jgi:hypothetical protein
LQKTVQLLAGLQVTSRGAHALSLVTKQAVLSLRQLVACDLGQALAICERSLPRSIGGESAARDTTQQACEMMQVEST